MEKETNIVRVGLTQVCNKSPVLSSVKSLDSKEVSSIQRSIYDKLISLIYAAKSEGCKIVCLNELCNAPYFAISEYNPQWLKFAQDCETGEASEVFRLLSKELNILIIAPLYEHTKEDKYYNTTLLFENGVLMGKSRKTNIPFGKNEKGMFTEKDYYRASDDPTVNAQLSCVNTAVSSFLPVFNTKYAKVGINTCYGRHFPENWRVLKRGGAEVVFCPSVTFGAVSERVWEYEIPTVAVWNEIFVCASNRTGIEFPDKQAPNYFGKSYVVDPCGNKLKLTKKTFDDDSLIIADLDLALVGSNPSGWHLEDDQREDILLSLFKDGAPKRI